MKRNELYDSVTNRIVAELEAGAVPWVKPWSGGGAAFAALPHNAVTGRSYRGVNILTLWDAASRGAYQQPAWMTFLQTQSLGGRVRKGEKGTRVVFMKRIDVEEETDDGSLRTKEVSVLRGYVLFNVLQVEDLPERFYTIPEVADEEERIAHVEELVGALDARIRHGGDTACFVPSLDHVCMPDFVQFETPEHYYATLLHELGHWSGHSRRLNRDFSGRFGTRAYAAEELVAELTAAFLCASLGIEGQLRHAGYIASWLELLRSDNRAIFTAASKASQAADFLTHYRDGDTWEGVPAVASGSEKGGLPHATAAH